MNEKAWVWQKQWVAPRKRWHSLFFMHKFSLVKRLNMANVAINAGKRRLKVN